MVTKLLFVCLGNICRSAAAEGVFLNLLCSRGLKEKYEVDSAGTGGWHVGERADSRMRNAAKRRGIDISSRARQLTLNDLEVFDLILTMDAQNLAFVESLAKEAGSKVTIRPILSYATRTKILDVPDPYYGGDIGFEKVLDLLQDACGGLLEELT